MKQRGAILSLFFFASVAAAVPHRIHAAASTAPLAVEFNDPQHPWRFRISVQGSVWLQSSADLAIHCMNTTATTANGTLLVTNHTTVNGATTLHLHAVPCGVHMRASASASTDGRELLFVQEMDTNTDNKQDKASGGGVLRGTNVAASVLGGVIFAWPALDVNAGMLPALQYLTLWQNMQPNAEQLGAKQGTGLHGLRLLGQQSGVPLVLYRPTSKLSSSATDAAVVIGPSTYLKQATQSVVGDAFQCGINGHVQMLPATYRHETRMVLGNGVYAALDDWGTGLQRAYGKNTIKKQHTANRNRNRNRTSQGSRGSGVSSTLDTPSSNRGTVVVRKLGYWTDNGAHYYYHTLSKNATYTETMLALRKHHQQIGLPYGYYQLDSWFYYKGKHSGLVEWKARPDVFKDGLPALHEQMGGVPLAAHTRWFSPQNVYAEQGWPFYTDARGAAPRDPFKFFSWLIGHAASKWGLAVFEQDWSARQFFAVNEFMHNLTAADEWMQGMGRAAANSDVSIGFGTSMPSDVVASVQSPAALFVFSVQNVACPTVECPAGWNLGKVALLVRSLGLRPMKDVWWSTSRQPGNPLYGNSSFVNMELHALVATLSTGPVGVGDKLGAENVSLILQTCDTNTGDLLQPDAAVVAAPPSLSPDWLGGELWHTFSVTQTGRVYIYVFSAQLVPPQCPYSLLCGLVYSLQNLWPYIPSTYIPQGHATPPSQPPQDAASYISYDYYTGVLASMATVHSGAAYPADTAGLYIPASTVMEHNKVDFHYHVLVPVLDHQWVMLGECTKYSMAARLPSAAAANSTAIRFTGPTPGAAYTVLPPSAYALIREAPAGVGVSVHAVGAVTVVCTEEADTEVLCVVVAQGELKCTCHA